jgi:phosphoribosyl-ATP pyrophosphohydrolase
LKTKASKRKSARPSQLPSSPGKRAPGKAGDTPGVDQKAAPAPVEPAGESPPVPPIATQSAEVLARLWSVVEAKQGHPARASHAARLLRRGMPYVAQKLGEEAVECVVELLGGDKQAIVLESADLLYHLVAAWVAAGVPPEDVWNELNRRIQLGNGTGGASRRPLNRSRARAAGTSKIP